MKKIVAAFLSIVLTITTCLIPAFAIDSSILALSDIDQIDAKYLEAIEYVVSENIITGYSDGTFHPKGVLTRGAASRMLAVMSLGTDAANALIVSNAPFSDVPVDNIFSGCVSYCVASGFAGGYSDGTFRPKSALTAGAFAKMLLMYIKYQPDLSRYTGSSWLTNVTADALSCGIFTNDMGFTPSGDLTREGAAYLIYNAKHWDGTPSTSVSPTTSATPTAPTAIALSATTQTINVGQGIGLKATITPSTATDKTVTWSSSNRKIATVDATGYVWGNTAGTVTITAKTANGKTTTCTVTVTAPLSQNNKDVEYAKKAYQYLLGHTYFPDTLVIHQILVSDLEGGTVEGVTIADQIVVYIYHSAENKSGNMARSTFKVFFYKSSGDFNFYTDSTYAPRKGQGDREISIKTVTG